MSLPSRTLALKQKVSLGLYLTELSQLLGRSVKHEELESLDHTKSMRMAAQRMDSKNCQPYKIKFSERNSPRFMSFLRGLKDANSSPIYLWTPRTIDCGSLLVPALEAIDFGFSFNINHEGILTFSTSDLVDTLLLDFSIDAMGEQVMLVETSGSNWTKVIY